MIGAPVIATGPQARLEQHPRRFVVALVIRHHAAITDQWQTPEKIAGPRVRLPGNLEELPRAGKISPLEQHVGGEMEGVGQSLKVTDLTKDFFALIEMQPGEAIIPLPPLDPAESQQSRAVRGRAPSRSALD